MLAAPTVAEVARALGRALPAALDRPRRRGDGGSHREVGRADRRRDGPGALPRADRGRRPGDHPGGPRRHRRRQPGRAPVGHLPRRWPGWCSPAARSPRRCPARRRLRRAGVPVVAVGDDTYTVTSAVTAVRGAITARSPRQDRDGRRRCSRTTSTPTALRRADHPGPPDPHDPADVRARADRAGAGRPARTSCCPRATTTGSCAAAEQLLLRGVVDLTVLGAERDVRARAAALGLTCRACASSTR